MPYSIDPLSDGCYKGTTVLINKFNIQNEKQLDIVEQSITGALLAKAFIEIPFENVSFSFYKMLHHYVFDDIYDWAGKTRIVNMSKKGTNFCDFDKIEEYADRIFNDLLSKKYLMEYSNESFINEFTNLYCSLNYLHPFREGNGRIQRLFLSMLLKNAGKNIDFTKIDKDLFMIATIKSVSGDIFMLKDIFRENIS
ncbi:MAG: Fic family protein [Clostridia bacterium]|nr:Fic family protein [Clostridia bacterium]